MDFQPPEEGLRRSETVFGGIDVTEWELTSSKDPIVQRTTAEKGLPEFDLDFDAIRRRAQAARSEWVAERLKAYYEAIVRRFRERADLAATSAVLKNARSKAA